MCMCVCVGGESYQREREIVRKKERKNGRRKRQERKKEKCEETDIGYG